MRKLGFGLAGRGRGGAVVLGMAVALGVGCAPDLRLVAAGSGGSGGEGGQGGGDPCSNRKQDGNETDVDCGGSCGACDLGMKCRAGTDCATAAFCVDSVCCNEACAVGECKACTQAKKMDDSADGTCGPAKVDTMCEPGSCADGTETVANTCDAMGACSDNGTTACNPGYTCNAESTACATTCAQSSDCATCYECNAGACTPVAVNGTSMGCDGTNACDGAGSCKPGNGATCAAAGECASGNCADGICCDQACDGECQACNLTDLVGTCSPVAFGERDAPLCSTQSDMCNATGECKLPPGQPCTDNAECVTGVCTTALGRCGALPTP